ncbi:MAG: hypothetical protein QM756_33595 [Polyangiaceae bacterium]
MTKTKLRVFTVATTALALAGGAFLAGGAWAGGIPTVAPVLTYSGVLEDGAGVPLTGDTHNVALKLWTAETKGTAACDTGTPTPLALDVHGGFSVPLDACADAIKANPNLWVEVLVDGATLGRAKLGAVPYALEAGHSTSADGANSAKTVPFTGVSGVPVTLAANSGSNPESAARTAP